MAVVLVLALQFCSWRPGGLGGPWFLMRSGGWGCPVGNLWFRGCYRSEGFGVAGPPCEENSRRQLGFHGVNREPTGSSTLSYGCAGILITLCDQKERREPPSTSTVHGTELTWTLPHSHKLDCIFAYEQRETLC